MRGAALLIALLAGNPGFADINSVRPMPRPVLPDAAPVAADAPLIVASAASPTRSIRPPRRPDGVEMTAKAPAAMVGRNPGKGLLGRLFGPPGTGETAVVAKKPEAVPAPSVKGSVCQDPRIRGVSIPDIRGEYSGCGVTDPVRVSSVDGVTLSTPATMDCDTARALRIWVTDKVKPAFGSTGITGFRVAAHYVCRGRNRKKSARISEHGRGKAIDISGFMLGNGAEVSVLTHYDSEQGKAIRAAQKGACGIFGTTLGPGSDGYHEDHLHFDTAHHRGGAYCK